MAKWDFGRFPRPWEYERKRRGKDGGNGTLKQRDVDRWMIMGFFFPSRNHSNSKSEKKSDGVDRWMIMEFLSGCKPWD